MNGVLSDEERLSRRRGGEYIPAKRLNVYPQKEKEGASVIN